MRCLSIAYLARIELTIQALTVSTMLAATTIHPDV